MMILKKIILAFLKIMLFLLLLAGTISSATFAGITLIPDSTASKVSLLGYKAHCSFTPISTVILVIMALIFGAIFWRLYGKGIMQIVRRVLTLV